MKECLALHVYFNEAAVTYPEYDQVIQGQEEKAFFSFVEKVDRHGVRVRPIFEECANVAHGVQRMEEQHGTDLVVMNTRGRSRSAAVLLGSETEHTLIETRIPILVVKHLGSRLSLLQALLDKDFRHRPEPRFD
jgi:nucleotide-binding universal stress UspA family protein